MSPSRVKASRVQPGWRGPGPTSAPAGTPDQVASGSAMEANRQSRLKEPWAQQRTECVPQSPRPLTLASSPECLMMRTPQSGQQLWAGSFTPGPIFEPARKTALRTQEQGVFPVRVGLPSTDSRAQSLEPPRVSTRGTPGFPILLQKATSTLSKTWLCYCWGMSNNPNNFFQRVALTY